MKLADFVVKDSILCDLKSSHKEDAIREIVQSLVDVGAIKSQDFEGIVAAIMKREELGSTGIGNGVAVPHTKHVCVDRMIGTVCVAQRAFDFQSIDREPVDILFLLVSPPERPGDHLRALETISRHLRAETFCRFLRQAKTRQEIVDILEEADQNKFD